MPGLVSGHRKNLAPTNHTASIDWQGRGFKSRHHLAFPALSPERAGLRRSMMLIDMPRVFNGTHSSRFRTRLQGGIPFQRHLASRIPEDDVFVKTARNKVVSAPALTMCFTFIVVYITSC